MKSENAYSKVVAELLIERGTQDALKQVLRAMRSLMYVTASTEVEAYTLSSRAEQDKLKEHWRGRQEAAWSIRRHCFEEAEKAMKLLEKLVPVPHPAEESARSDLWKRVKLAKNTARNTIAKRKATLETT